VIRQLAAERLTPSQATIVSAATTWADRENRVRALFLKGSLGRGDGDSLSDVDLVVVSQGGRRSELWSERRSVAEALGRPLGVFREVPWSDPNLVIVFYDGPQKVDLYFEDSEPEATWWLQEGYAVLIDKYAVAVDLEARLAGLTTPDDGGFDWLHDDLFEFDSHVWDWTWAALVKLQRPGEGWYVYFELVGFLNTMVFAAYNALAGEVWRGVRHAELRLPRDLLERMEAALPRRPDRDELLRSLRTLVALYVDARQPLQNKLGVELDDRLMNQVRQRIEAPIDTLYH
jgi:predicted nucleotidyltransferase